MHICTNIPGRDTETRQNTQNARSARRKSYGEHNGYLYYRSRESPRLGETLVKLPTTTKTTTSQSRRSWPNWSHRPPSRHKYWWKRCVYTRTTSPSAVKKPEDLSGRGLPTTAISERIVHQVKLGSVSADKFRFDIMSRESLCYLSFFIIFSIFHFLVSFLSLLFPKSNHRDAQNIDVCFIISVVKFKIRIVQTAIFIKYVFIKYL